MDGEAPCDSCAVCSLIFLIGSDDEADYISWFNK
jgi:hypothetical protein